VTINTDKIMESWLQKKRFNIILPYIQDGKLLDFGGNKGELGPYLSKSVEYFYCNENYKKFKETKFQTIVMCAVLEHLPLLDIGKVMNDLVDMLDQNGRLIITTPTRLSKPILEIMSGIGLLMKDNIEEHSHYWNKKDLLSLVKERPEMEIIAYGKFELGMNQFIIFTKRSKK